MKRPDSAWLRGMVVAGSTPAELAALMAREIPRWAEVIKKSGAKPD